MYSVDDKGNVWSNRSNKFLSHRIMESGHHYVTLCWHQSRWQVGVHVLVKITHGEDLRETHIVRHWDDNPHNNNIDNLLWGSYSDNKFDQVRNGKHPSSNKTHCPRGAPLLGKNLLTTKTGARRCKACEKVRGYLRYHKELPEDIQTFHDKCYNKIEPFGLGQVTGKE